MISLSLAKVKFYDLRARIATKRIAGKTSICRCLSRNKDIVVSPERLYASCISPAWWASTVLNGDVLQWNLSTLVEYDYKSAPFLLANQK